MNKRLPIFIGLFLTLFAGWVLITSNSFIHSARDSLDNLGYDIQLKAHILSRHTKPSPVIAIIDIDDRSLEAEGRWPWPRSKLARLVDELHKNRAAVVVFDMFFSEKDANLANTIINKISKDPDVSQNVITTLRDKAPLFDEDQILATSLTHGKTVLSLGFLPRKQMQNILPPPLFTLTKKQSEDLNFYKAKGYVVSIPALQDAAKHAGFINIFADSDGIFRHAPMLVEYNYGVYPSLAIQAVMTYIGTPIELITPNYGGTEELEGIKIGQTIVPIDINGQALIPFIGRSFTFPYFSATDVLKGKIKRSDIQGKIVFIGASATGLGDLKATAIQNPFPGVEIQATLANGILDNNFSYRPAWTYGANIVITMLLGLIAAFMFPYFGPRTLAGVILIAPIILLALNNLLWEQTGLILSFLVPVMLITISAIINMIYGYLFESRRREHLKAMFGQYVPSKHIDEMLQTKDTFGLHGEDRDMSVLFADIRGFTTISEGMTAKQLVELLNTYFTPMTEIIFKNRGTIDKYVGDLIMAFWGAPLTDNNHARHAIQSAISMQKKAEELAETLKDKNWPDIKIGVGICSGKMSVGDMGSQYRRNYTVLGDNVNLGARVEGLTKFYGVNIIVTESTRHEQTGFIFRKLDRVRVKGKSRGTDIYEILGNIESLTPELDNELNLYNTALDAYFSQKWEEAFSMMQSLHNQHPDTTIYKIFIKRIEDYKQNPVPADWDGVYAHLSK
tara:strand:- start:1233 stop:3434 length:2202 start_codon:yes stop_codon:yes gene_type:complete